MTGAQPSLTECFLICINRKFGYFFVHFFEGQLRPVACGALSFEGKNVSFLGKKSSFFLLGVFQFSGSEERPAVL